VSYRGKVKNGGNHRNASDNVEHIFGNGFEHQAASVADADPGEQALNWAFISTSSQVVTSSRVQMQAITDTARLSPTRGGYAHATTWQQDRRDRSLWRLWETALAGYMFFSGGPVWRDSMAKSALIAVAVAFLLGGTSLAAAKTKNAAGTQRSPSHPGVNEQVPGVNEQVTASPRPTAANPYYRLSDEYYGYSDPYRGLYDSLPRRLTFRVTPTAT
jgi:hypothetical protein